MTFIADWPTSKIFLGANKTKFKGGERNEKKRNFWSFFNK